MSEVVSADLTISFNVSDVTSTGTLSGATTAVAETNKLFYGGNSLTAIGKQWSGLLTLSASTPQTLNLTSLTGPYGSTVDFASVAAIYVYNNGVNPIAMGNASSPFNPGWDAGTHIETIVAGSRWCKENNATPWTTTSATNLKFDPGSLACSCRVIIIGS